MRIRFFRLFLVLFAYFASSSAHAGDDALFLQQILQQRSPDMNPALPAWLHREPAALNPALEALLRKDAQIATKGESQLARKGKSTQGRWIFVSFGMPEQELRAAAVAAAEQKATLVFRGIGEGENMGEFARRLGNLMKGMKSRPGVVIDPPLFSRFHVGSVPTEISSDAEGNAKIVRGLPGFDWLENKPVGDHGQQGPTFAITEPDMIEEIKRRIQNIDWGKQREEAIAHYWQRHGDFLDLPEAEQDRSRLIDPSIAATQDIHHPDGRLIVAAGQKINPQAVMPMRHVYIVFDPTRPKQTAIAATVGQRYLKKGTPVVYLFSRLDSERGWEHLKELNSLLKAPAYQLNKTIVERFAIRKLPASVSGSGDQLLVREYSVRARRQHETH